MGKIEVGTYLNCGSCDAWAKTDNETYSLAYRGEEHQAWKRAHINSPEEALLEWKARRVALTLLLKRLVKNGVLTQEQADEQLAEWDKNHPNPDPEEQPIDVTEAFGIPVRIPEKVHAE
jgi:hypothetical protein